MENLITYPVRYNHVGYVPQAPKIFFVDPVRLDLEGSFKIVDEMNLVHFEGRLKEGSFEHRGLCDYSGENLWSGDFSSFQVPGKFAIEIVLKGGQESFQTRFFEISEDWLFRQLQANVKSFFFQRSGVELPKSLAGNWARPAAHFDECIKFHKMMNREGTWNAHGGWYDAGDYGKYIVNGGISVGTLLLACSMWDSKKQECAHSSFSDVINEGGSFSQPYSLKEEIRFELDFFLRMQDHDGGVFFKVSPEHWDGFVSPQDSDLLQKRLILGKSTTSSLNFAGALAQAYSVYRKSDAEFAKRCLDASKRAYGWAVEHPEETWPHNTEGSGGYGDEHFDDEFFWARAALFCSLFEAGGVDQKLLAEIAGQLRSDMEKNPPAKAMDWRDTQNMGWALLALQDYDVSLRNDARRALEKVAQEIISLQKQDAYGISIRRFIWGSNGEISNHALTLEIVRNWTETLLGENLSFWSLEMLNFIYGRNPVNRSFVTGSAWSSPMHIHHRLSHADNVKDPIPGLLSGGINCDRQDLHRAPHYFSGLPGHSYTDERCSFASNETAINWNSPLTAVLAMHCR